VVLLASAEKLAVEGLHFDARAAGVVQGIGKIEAFVELDAFKKQAGEISRALRASQKAPGHDRIYTPGEKEYEISLFRKDKGVPFNAPLKKAFRDVKEKLNLPHVLPF